MPKGEFAAKELIKKRKRIRMLKNRWKRKYFHLKAKYDPVGTVPMAKALVLQKFVLRPTTPLRAHKVCASPARQERKDRRGVRSIRRHDKLDKEEHDEVTIQGMGGSQRRQMGSIPGLKYRVIAVNRTDIYQIVKGKKEKPKR